MKKYGWIAILMSLVLAIGSVVMAQAEIIPAFGFGQIGLSSVVLCEKLSLRESASFSAKVVQTLDYGTHIIVMDQSDGWAHCTLGDSEDSLQGWVNADYIAIDPAWYRTEKQTPVYAWNDTSAPKVALLDEDVTLPILRESGDWLIVSLRGAVGCVHK